MAPGSFPGGHTRPLGHTPRVGHEVATCLPRQLIVERSESVPQLATVPHFCCPVALLIWLCF